MSLAGVGVTGQMLGAAKTLSNGFQTDPMDGILGMGWASLSSMGATPVFPTVSSAPCSTSRGTRLTLGLGPALR